MYQPACIKPLPQPVYIIAALPDNLPVEVRLKFLCVFVLILLQTSFIFAQRNFQQPPAYSPQLTAELKQLQEAALKSDYAWDQLAHLTNNIGPRPAGSAQANFAAQYVAAELRKLGLEVKLEKVVVPHWVRGEETGALVEFPGMAPGTTQKVVLTALGGDKVAGKIVLFNYKFDKQLAATGHGGPAYGQAVIYRAIGASAAAKQGAIAALVRSVGGADYRIPHTGAMIYLKDAPQIP